MNQTIKHLKEEILLTAMGLEEGETKAFPCPQCRAPHENKLYVTRKDGGLLFNCKRAACGFSGRIGCGGISMQVPSMKKKKQPRIFDKERRLLSDSEVGYLEHKYHLTMQDILHWGIFGVKEEEGVIVYPLYDMYYNKLGYQTKLIRPNKDKKEPKNITYQEDIEQDVNIHSHYFAKEQKYTGTIVVVEDCLSAMRVAEYVDCLALLGTNLSKNLAIRLSARYDKLIIMLDPDAANAAEVIASNYRSLFNTTIIYTSQDPKDMAPSTLSDTLLVMEHKWNVNY